MRFVSATTTLTKEMVQTTYYAPKFLNCFESQHSVHIHTDILWFCFFSLLIFLWNFVEFNWIVEVLWTIYYNPCEYCAVVELWRQHSFPYVGSNILVCHFRFISKLMYINIYIELSWVKFFLSSFSLLYEESRTIGLNGHSKREFANACMACVR